MMISGMISQPFALRKLDRFFRDAQSARDSLATQLRLGIIHPCEAVAMGCIRLYKPARTGGNSQITKKPGLRLFHPEYPFLSCPS